MISVITNGIKGLFSDQKDHVCFEQKRTGEFYEAELLKDISNLNIEEEKVVVDVGAHFGNHSVYFAKHFNKKVYSFEACEETFSILKSNILLNDLTERIIPIFGAVSSSEGYYKVIKDDSFNVGTNKIEISDEGNKAYTINSFFKKIHVGLIKIDVEGHECQVLDGAMDIIERDSPFLCIECENRVSLINVINKIKNKGYIVLNGYNATPTFLFAHENKIPDGFSNQSLSLSYIDFRQHQKQHWEYKKRSEQIGEELGTIKTNLFELESELDSTRAKYLKIKNSERLKIINSLIDIYHRKNIKRSVNYIFKQVTNRIKLIRLNMLGKRPIGFLLVLAIVTPFFNKSIYFNDILIRKNKQKFFKTHKISLLYSIFLKLRMVRSQAIKHINFLFYYCGIINLAARLVEKHNLSSNSAARIRYENDLLLNRIDIPAKSKTTPYTTNNNHILYVANFSLFEHLSGYSVRTHELCRKFSKFGKDVTVFVLPKHKEIDKNKLESVFYDHIEYCIIGIDDAKKNETTTLFERVAKIELAAKKYNTSLIIAASSFDNALPAVIAAKHLGLPFVYEVRGVWELSRASKEKHWENSERYKLIDLQNKKIEKTADHVTCISKTLDEYLGKIGWKTKRTIISNSVDLSRFDPETLKNQDSLQLDVPKNRWIVGFIGSIVYYEGLDLLVRAAQKLQSEPFHFLIVGGGNDLNRLENLSKKLALKNITFTGKVPYAQILNYYSKIDLFVYPRIKAKVCEVVPPLKPLEAISLNKKVLFSDVKPLVEYADLIKSGMVFRAGSVNSLVENIKKIYSNREEVKYREIIKLSRTWEHEAEKYVNCIDEINLYNKNTDANETIKKIEKVKIAYIADEFTAISLSSDFESQYIPKNGWEDVLNSFNADILFVESAWKGVEGDWNKSVGYYSESEHRTIRKIVSHCKKNNIIVIFYNKEDPVHFNRFVETALLCDLIITTDLSSISRYVLKGIDPEKVICSSFVASYNLHYLSKSNIKVSNPKKTFMYAGSYYGDRYPERKKYLDDVLDFSKENGLVIYDRFYNDPKAVYKYPLKYKKYIKRQLSYKELQEKQHDFMYSINSNSVQNSATMMSRRIVESIASGVRIITPTSPSVKNHFDFPFVVEIDSYQSAFDLKLPEISEKSESDFEQYRDYIFDKMNWYSLLSYSLNRISNNYTRDPKVRTDFEKIVIKKEKNNKKKNLIVAGHDFKFFRSIIDRLKKDFNVYIDYWKGHDIHSAQNSSYLLDFADIIFCEWGLGNIMFYSKFKNNNQKLIVRNHMQELNRDFLKRSNRENIDHQIFVSKYYMDKFKRKFGVLNNEVVVYNYYNPLIKPKKLTDKVRFNLGFIGVVPARKRFDIALDVLEKLNEHDSRYKLYVKGKMPEEYPWIMSNSEEVKYYDKIFDRISNSKTLRENVIFEPFDLKIHEWFKKIGYILSTSDAESFHLSIADGIAAGCIPLSLNWPGFSTIYPAEWSSPTRAAIVEKVINGITENQKYILYAENFSLEKIYGEIKNLIKTPII